MKNLRPHQVFDKVHEADRLATICMPRRHSLTSMLERAILASLLKLIQPRTVFEFGTYLGETTLILAANTNAKVYSIDLDEGQLKESNRYLDEFERTNAQKRFSEPLVFCQTQYERQIETIIGDSITYDFSSFYLQIDFVLIDGGHQVDVVDSDTQQAFRMLSIDHAACIMWHDYGNPKYGITNYLNDLSHSFDLYNVAETSYVFFIKNVGGYHSLSW